MYVTIYSKRDNYLIKNIDFYTYLSILDPELSHDVENLKIKEKRGLRIEQGDIFVLFIKFRQHSMVPGISCLPESKSVLRQTNRGCGARYHPVVE